MDTIAYSFDQCKDQLLEINEQKDFFHIWLDVKRQLVLIEDDLGEKVAEFRPPLPCPAMRQGETLGDYIARFPEEIPSYTLVLMQAGAAALGYFEEGEVQLHKAIKKYMIRRKQGKAQFNYLNTRGKSKAGSRVRLNNTQHFFEEINEYLTHWEAYEPAEKIIYSCTARLWGMLFQSKVETPFDKKDERLIKVPRDVGIPDFEELLRINRFVKQGWLMVYQEGVFPQ